MLRPVGRGARPSGRSPGSCWSSPRAARVWASMRPKISSEMPRMRSSAYVRSSLWRKIGRTLRFLHVAVATLDDLLVLVEAQHVTGGDAAREVRRDGVDPVEAGGGIDRLPVDAARSIPGGRSGVVRFTSIRPVVSTPGSGRSCAGPAGGSCSSRLPARCASDRAASSALVRSGSRASATWVASSEEWM